MLTRTLEPEVMDTVEEATDYDAMDHSHVNRVFVTDLLAAAECWKARLPADIPQVLDVGTGTALIPIELCRTDFDGHITAIDLAAEMLKLAQVNVDRARMSQRISLQLVDAKRLPFEDEAIDWVISNSIVHHIPEPRACLAEMLRVLKPNGLLFVRDLLRPESGTEVEHLVATYAGNDSARQQQLFRQSLHAALSLDELRTMLSELGIAPEAAHATSDRHWTVAVIPKRAGSR